MFNKKFILLTFLFLSLIAAAEADDLKIDTKIHQLLSSFCYDCHDEDSAKGGIQLDNLSTLKLDARLDLLNRVQEQIFTENMPPKKKKQPPQAERNLLMDWAADELARHQASKLEDKLRFYRYGNYINHEKLFSGEIKEKAYTPARRWLINEIIYNELVNEVFRLDGKQRQDKFYGVVKPFNLPGESGVKYYDTGSVEGGQFLTLLSNAEWIVERQLRPALLKSGDFKYPPEFADAKGRSMIYKFPGEMWNLKKTEAAFEKIILSKGVPGDSDLRAAVNLQFQGAMQRSASAAEMQKYLAFTKYAIKLGGNAAGLKKMMVSVLMEPEFIYRNELGDGRPDEFGRMKLTGREASYAIAYALTDKIPDNTLVAAAEDGRLQNKKDYEREVRRILTDSSVEKPRLLRFFQDYFGYYNMFNVFKDEERFGGAYGPHRVVAARFINRIPGKLTQEADALINWALKQDKNVLETLLTTEKFFVHHSGDNEEMKKTIEKVIAKDKVNRQVYNFLKDKNWKKDTRNLLEEAKKKFGREVSYGFRTFDGTMMLFAERFGKDGNKEAGIPMPPDNEAVDHSVKMYNLDYKTWSYEPVQPFKLANRMGMLTHPAWLVAHSQNDHTDPVTRGKWIREKLLAGFIPDVPITVDAKIPEDHHKSLRERFAVTEAENCWGCHKKMNPLGYVFESFDDFGRYRSEENLEHEDNILKTVTERARGKHGVWVNFKMPVYKTKAVNSEGHLDGTGDASLDGKVKDYRDLMTRLAKSTRVRQSFVRNVFRYFMGRNEMLSDSQTLIEADRAYVESGGSFKELVVSLLTSDSFIYRKDISN